MLGWKLENFDEFSDLFALDIRLKAAKNIEQEAQLIFFSICLDYFDYNFLIVILLKMAHYKIYAWSTVE